MFSLSPSVDDVGAQIQFELEDGEVLTGKLYLPADGDIEQVVIYVHGTGPATYLTRRDILRPRGRPGASRGLSELIDHIARRPQTVPWSTPPTRRRFMP